MNRWKQKCPEKSGCGMSEKTRFCQKEAESLKLTSLYLILIWPVELEE